MSAIEPGESFPIEFGKNKRRLQVVALNGRQKRRAVACMANLRSAKDPDAMLAVLDELEQVTKVCSPTITEEIIETLDDALQAEIVSKTLMRTVISEDDSKKSE